MQKNEIGRSVLSFWVFFFLEHVYPFESATIHSSYLQNLCVAAAYRPVHELLEEEKKVLVLF
jgi:hypothetical protein